MDTPNNLAATRVSHTEDMTSIDEDQKTIAVSSQSVSTSIDAIISSNFDGLVRDDKYEADIALGLDLIKIKLVYKESLRDHYSDLEIQSYKSGFNIFSFCGAIWVGLEAKARKDVCQEINTQFNWASTAHRVAFKQAFNERRENFLESFIFEPESGFGDEIYSVFERIRTALGENALLEMQMSDRKRFLQHCRL